MKKRLMVTKFEHWLWDSMEMHEKALIKNRVN